MKKSFLFTVIIGMFLLIAASCSNSSNNVNIKSFTITFDGNGGIVSQKQMTLLSGDPVGFLPKAKLDGFVFSGWNTEKNGSGSVLKIGSVISSDLTVYAQWGTALSYVEYYPNYPDNSNKKKKTAEFPYGDIYQIEDSTFTYEGYSFTGWNTKEDGSGDDWAPSTLYFGTETLKLYAQWTPEYGHSFKVNHYQQNTYGSYPDTPTSTNTYFGYTDTYHDAPTKSFTGFNTPETQHITIKSDNSVVVNYYYERKTIYLTFDAAGGSFPMEYPLSQEGKFILSGLYGSSFTIPYISRDGYDFSWDPLITNTIMPASDKTYTANWTLRTHSITYNLNGGIFEESFSPKTTFTELESVTLPTRSDVRKNGYAFAGWYEDPECLGTRFYSWTAGQQKSDISLYIKWVEVSNTWGGMKSIDESWYDSSKSKFVLKSAEEFAGLASLINKGNTFQNKTIEMDFDLILNEDHLNYESWATKPPVNVWTGLGYSSRPFKGILDGKGHSIYGMYMDAQTIKGSFGGFIGYLSGGIVKNLNIIDCYIENKSNASCFGVIVGEMQGYSIVDNCTVKGIIISNSTVDVGGIVGRCYYGTIQNSTNYATVISSGTGDVGEDEGGILGIALNGDTKIINCVNHGSVTGTKRGSVGGIIGTVMSSKARIIDCINYGDVNGYTEGSGGILGTQCSGSSSRSDILNCTNYGSINSSSFGSGGIVGETRSGILNITNSVNHGPVKAARQAGGIIGCISTQSNYSSTGIKTDIKNCVNTGKVTASSYIGGIEGYRGSGLSSTQTAYCYYISSSASKGFGTTTTGNMTGCGSFESYTSPITLMHTITGGTETSTYSLIHADNSSTTVIEALNSFTAVNSSLAVGTNTYDIRPWASDENGMPELQY